HSRARCRSSVSSSRATMRTTFAATRAWKRAGPSRAGTAVSSRKRSTAASSSMAVGRSFMPLLAGWGMPLVRAGSRLFSQEAQQLVLRLHGAPAQRRQLHRAHAPVEVHARLHHEHERELEAPERLPEAQRLAVDLGAALALVGLDHLLARADAPRRQRRAEAPG